MRFRTKIVSGLFVSLVLAPARSGAEPKSAPGPETAGGAPAFEHVHALALDARGRVLWLGAHTGLYRSEDGGRSWTKVALPVAHHEPDVMAIATHPTEPEILYVGTHEAGVLRSTDGGRTWRAANAGLGGLDVHGLAIDPNTPAKLHALVRGTGAGVYDWRGPEAAGASWGCSSSEGAEAMPAIGRRTLIAGAVLGPALAVLALLAYGFTREPRDIGSPLLGRPAPPFTLTLFDGRTLRLEDLRGRDRRQVPGHADPHAVGKG